MESETKRDFITGVEAATLYLLIAVLINAITHGFLGTIDTLWRASLIGFSTFVALTGLRGGDLITGPDLKSVLYVGVMTSLVYLGISYTLSLLTTTFHMPGGWGFRVFLAGLVAMSSYECVEKVYEKRYGN